MIVSIGVYIKRIHKCIHKCIQILFKKYSYSNTLETDVLVFICVFMEMKSIRIFLKVFAPGLRLNN